MPGLLPEDLPGVPKSSNIGKNETKSNQNFTRKSKKKAGIEHATDVEWENKVLIFPLANQIKDYYYYNYYAANIKIKLKSTFHTWVKNNFSSNYSNIIFKKNNVFLKCSAQN